MGYGTFKIPLTGLIQPLFMPVPSQDMNSYAICHGLFDVQ